MFIEELQRILAERQQINPSYSLRSFARQLSINPSTLSALLNKRRPLTTKTILSLLPKLDIEDEKKKKILLGELGESCEKDFEARVIPEAYSEVHSRWETFAVLSCLEIAPQKWSARKLSLTLGIPFGDVLVCLGLLEKCEFISEEKGFWSLSKRENTVSLLDVPNIHVRNGHKSKIGRSLISLEEDPVDIRDFSGITMAIDPKKIPEAKERIKKFRRELCQFLESENQQQVYQLNIQFFPMSHRKEQQ